MRASCRSRTDDRCLEGSHFTAKLMKLMNEID